jgi:opacity protein-like surface antigen
MSATDIGKIKMRKIIWATLIGSSLVAFTFNAAQAADLKPGEGFYISSSFGAVLPHDLGHYGTVYYRPEKSEVGYYIGEAMGYDFGAIRIEKELSWRTTKFDYDHLFAETTKDRSRVDVSVLSLMANAWYDIDTGTRFTPYIGGGAGVAQVTAIATNTQPDIKGSTDIVTGFAYQVGAGVDYSLTENIIVGLGYRYFATKTEVDESFQNVNIGMRYTF